jgi:deazaflavin-dependent oxidoreductase (nitroreductase family)
MKRDIVRTLGNKIANPLLTAILRSPLHSLVSHNMLLITFWGRRSGKRYTTPVGYVRDGDALIILSQAARVWCKNLRSGAPVLVRVRGREFEGHGVCFEDRETVGQGVLLCCARHRPFAGS